jgi:hypothetical protein
VTPRAAGWHSFWPETGARARQGYRRGIGRSCAGRFDQSPPGKVVAALGNHALAQVTQTHGLSQLRCRSILAEVLFSRTVLGFSPRLCEPRGAKLPAGRVQACASACERAVRFI